MDIRELRIGNIFHIVHKNNEVEYWTPLEISAEDNVKWKLVKGVQPIYDGINEIVPTPITEEILSKIKWDEKVPSLGLYVLDDVSYYFRNGKIEALTEHQCDPTAIVEYLHDLQNLHYALRKNELQIEL